MAKKTTKKIVKIRTTDNNGGKKLENIKNEDRDNLSSIANKNLSELQKDKPDLLIFPQSLGQYHDDIEKPCIFSLDDNILTTNNIMGFVGIGSTQLTITSRFSKDEGRDYFLHYMLQKVYALNILNFEQTTDKENIWDFLLYLFPYFLKKAYTQGIYKAYKKIEYNDANVKGVINIKNHITKNIPFLGKIAYTSREHSYDNNITMLIKHTIEYIRSHKFGSQILTSDSKTREIVSKFDFITQDTYNRNARQKIIGLNSKPVSHPCFTEYKALQDLCLKILRINKLTYGDNENKVYGLLFDGAWLWEEYLNTFLQKTFIHPENKTGKNKYFLFERNKQAIYPDFISKDDPKKVGDAKYIPLDNQGQYPEGSEKATSIYYKTITYMYRFNSKYGFLLFPSQSKNDDNEEIYKKGYVIKDTGGVLEKIGLVIPKGCETFAAFSKAMKDNEEKVLTYLLKNKL